MAIRGIVATQLYTKNCMSIRTSNELLIQLSISIIIDQTNIKLKKVTNVVALL